MRELHASLAASQRRAAEMHSASARLQAAYAEQIQGFLGRVSTQASMPRFLTAVADVIGAASAAVILWNSEHVVAASMGTDLLARAALDIELTVGEGPAHATALERRVVVVREPDLAVRWPDFARATAGMHLHVVAAAPLERGTTSLGALTVFDPPWSPDDAQLDRLQSVADALVESLAQEVSSLEEGTEGPPLLDEDRTAVVHQAAGIVTTQSHCDLPTALALIHARAFADDVPSFELAERIVAGELRLDD
jgi:transcriptional regulator with GAF, ATPase, and Fis domain